jgi:hypothetical protein
MCLRIRSEVRASQVAILIATTVFLTALVVVVAVLFARGL